MIEPKIRFKLEGGPCNGTTIKVYRGLDPLPETVVAAVEGGHAEVRIGDPVFHRHAVRELVGEWPGGTVAYRLEGGAADGFATYRYIAE